MDSARLSELGAPGKTTVLKNTRLIDGTGKPCLENASVAVRDGRIVACAGTDDSLTGDDGIDCAGMTLLPGLIDAHAHLIYSGFRSLDAIDRCSIEMATVNAVVNAARVLRAGFTSLRDVGTFEGVAVAVRDAVAAGKISGPRITASGPIISATSGPGDTLPPHWKASYGLGRTANGVDELRCEVRRQIGLGVDNIKIAASGVEVGPHAWTWMTTFSEEEIRVVVDEAHRWGRTVAVHAQSYDSVRFSLKAGADTIEHGTRMDDETIAMFAASNAVLIPTLSTLFSVLELGASLNLLPKQRDEMEVNHPLWLDSLKRAHAAGVPVAAGGDIGNRYPQGSNAREMALLVRAGFSPMEALCAGTSIASRTLKERSEVGSVEPGKIADLLLFNGDPLADIESLQDQTRIALVIQGGKAVAGTLLSAAS